MTERSHRTSPKNCATKAIGATAAYMHGMGTVIRCSSCDTVLIRVAQARGRYFLDMRGVRVLQSSTEAGS